MQHLLKTVQLVASSNAKVGQNGEPFYLPAAGRKTGGHKSHPKWYQRTQPTSKRVSKGAKKGAKGSRKKLPEGDPKQDARASCSWSTRGGQKGAKRVPRVSKTEPKGHQKTGRWTRFASLGCYPGPCCVSLCWSTRVDHFWGINKRPKGCRTSPNVTKRGRSRGPALPV